MYFAGHGYIEDTGGFLCASDSESGDDALALADVMTLANSSPARNRVVILDSCHGGIAGEHQGGAGHSELATGVTILTASTAAHYALEADGSGVFTSLLVDALNGAAANLIGAITPGSVYAHIDQSLGSWAQRPVFKTNVKTFVSLREADAPIALGELQQLSTLFPTPDHRFALDSTYEEQRSSDDAALPPPDPANVATFKVLQNLVRVNLVWPFGAPHMWHAAMQSQSCELTVLGQHYWRLSEASLL